MECKAAIFDNMCRVMEKYYHVSDDMAIMEDCMKRTGKKLSVSVPVKKGVPGILAFFREKGVQMVGSD